MFDEPTLREILLLSSDNINDYVAHLKEICGTRRKQKKLTDKKKLRNVTN